MSWSLELRNGDLTAGGARLGTVTGNQKLIQDLRCWILERMGTDNLHPGYGSLIDGGRTPQGATYSSLIGESHVEFAAAEIESDLNRIIQDYQRAQLARVKGERLNNHPVSLTPGEVLLEINGINFEMTEDRLRVSVSLLTGSGDDVHIDVPLEGNG